jgi:membrane associated rhomboid family serine protease
VAQNAYRPPTTFSFMPPVIKNLLIINGLVFLAQYVFAQWSGNPFFGPVERYFALWPIGAPDVVRTEYGDFAWGRFYPWQLVTCAFLHGGLGHIFFNLFGLWMFGMRIEHVLGSARFAFFYLACVLGASLLQLAVISAPALLGTGEPGLFPTLGASGGVLGVMAAFGLLYPDEPIYLYFFVPIPAKWLVLGMAALDLYAGYAGTNTGVAHFAHLGGMVTGALLIQYWRGQLPFKPRRRPS